MSDKPDEEMISFSIFISLVEALMQIEKLMDEKARREEKGINVASHEQLHQLKEEREGLRERA